MRDFPAGVIALAAAGVACGGSSAPVAATTPVVAPASVDAGSPRPPAGLASFRIAAVSFDRSNLSWQKDRVTFDAGIFVYEARPRGLVLGGEVTDYADKIVEGTLGERRVRGVFLHHSAPRVDQKLFVALVANIVKLSGGGQPSCSVPTVTKIVEDVRGR